MAIFRHANSGIPWKIFATVFLYFIAGECDGSINILICYRSWSQR